MTEVSIKADALRGRMIIRDNDEDGTVFTVHCRNFDPYKIEAMSLGEAVDSALKNVGSFTRTSEWKVKQKMLSEKRSISMKKTIEAGKLNNPKHQSKPSVPVAKTA